MPASNRGRLVSSTAAELLATPALQYQLQVDLESRAPGGAADAWSARHVDAPAAAVYAPIEWAGTANGLPDWCVPV